MVTPKNTTFEAIQQLYHEAAEAANQENGWRVVNKNYADIQDWFMGSGGGHRPRLMSAFIEKPESFRTIFEATCGNTVSFAEYFKMMLGPAWNECPQKREISILEKSVIELTDQVGSMKEQRAKLEQQVSEQGQKIQRLADEKDQALKELNALREKINDVKELFDV